MFAGVVALTAQLAHHRIGNINHALYLLNRVHASGIVDVTSGDISFGGVTGPAATPATTWPRVSAPSTSASSSRSWRWPAWWADCRRRFRYLRGSAVGSGPPVTPAGPSSLSRAGPG